MIVTLFRSVLRPELEGTPEQEAYRVTNERMVGLARTMPGFVSVGALQDRDGRSFTVVVFEDEESHRAWRNHPEHLEAQRRGREDWYLEYSAEVLQPVRSYGWRREDA